MNRATAIRYRKAMVEGAHSLPDVDALNVPLMFERWEEGISYATGDRICHEEVLYKCAQGHTSQATWTPDITPALWVRVSIDEYPDWVQPTGAHDAYMTGDKVSHNDKHWVSVMDYNTYEPSVYGWEEVN